MKTPRTRRLSRLPLLLFPIVFYNEPEDCNCKCPERLLPL